tara:strand:+ start:76 stop:552 length:477 start_codon:yes stop_codon:yes gene_type:complete
MPIYCNNYDIHLYQGQSYYLDLDYTDVNDNVVDLNPSTYEARMQVRRSPLVEQKLIALNSEYYPNGVVGGGNTGYFVGSGFGLPEGTTGDLLGVIGTGGISLNYGGVEGTVRIDIDAETTANMPVGRHFYDLDVKDKTTGFVDKIITGTFEVLSEVTR